MPWLTISSAITSLRALINDGPSDKMANRKPVFGDLDGANRVFKTIEPRRVTDFTTTPAAAGTGVFYGNSAVVVSSDDILSGEFSVQNAPADGSQKLTASYYYQWFLDSELTQFLGDAGNWLGIGSDPTKIPDGLQPAALHFASKEGFSKLAVRMTVAIATMYQLEDAPKKDLTDQIAAYKGLADYFDKASASLRKGYYQRQDQAEAPLFGTISGNVRDVMPRR